MLYWGGKDTTFTHEFVSFVENMLLRYKCSIYNKKTNELQKKTEELEKKLVNNLEFHK